MYTRNFITCHELTSYDQTKKVQNLDEYLSVVFSSCSCLLTELLHLAALHFTLFLRMESSAHSSYRLLTGVSEVEILTFPDVFVASAVVVDRLRHHVAGKGWTKVQKVQAGNNCENETRITQNFGTRWLRHEALQKSEKETPNTLVSKGNRKKETKHILTEGLVQSFRIQIFQRTIDGYRR